jgi:hypothetical protein
MFAMMLLVTQSALPMPPQSLIPIEIVEKGKATKPKAVKPGNPFHFQRRSIAGEAKPVMSEKELGAFRDSYNLDDHAPFAIYEWADAPLMKGGTSKNRDYVFCSIYLKLGKGVAGACFQDKDRNRTLDAAARFEGGIPASGLAFTAITPVPYRYVNNQDYVPPHSMYTVEQMAIGYELDKASGLLHFGIFGGAGYVPIADFVKVDPASIPTTINVFGATVEVSAWDGKKATVAVTKPLPQIPVRVELPAFKNGKPVGRGYAVFVDDAIVR